MQGKYVDWWDVGVHCGGLRLQLRCWALIDWAPIDEGLGPMNKKSARGLLVLVVLL